MDKKQYRYELKFIIHENIAEVLKYRLSLLMDVDSNSIHEDHTYDIRSLYFDDIDDSAYYEKIDGLEKREKYRIRLYNGDDSFIRLERKEKNRDLTYKKQTRISKEMCLQFMDGDYSEIDLTEDKLLTEFFIKQQLQEIRPSVIVDYKRLAYTYPIEDVRITFDSDIRSGRYNHNLFDPNILTFPVLEPGEVVLEVKFNNEIPSHLVSVLGTVPMIREAVSKFALCREKKEV